MTVRRVLAVVPDLMDRSRLAGTPDVEVRFAGPGVLGAVDPTSVALVVVAVSRPGALAALAEATVAVPLVGFGPHVEDERLAAAMAAGCTRVLARSKFFARWPDV